MPHQVRHDIWAGGWGKRGVAGRRQSPTVGVAEDPARGRDWSEGEPSPSPKNLPFLQNFFDIRAAQIHPFV